MLTFKLLIESDITLLHKWLNNGEVLKWYGEGKEQSFEQIKGKYLPRTESDSLTKSYIIYRGDLPVGYIQWYLLEDYPDYSKHLDLAEKSAGVDLFLADEFIGQGLGAIAMKQFIQEYVFVDPSIKSIVIGPSVNNTRAIKTYKKAGFKYWKTVKIPKEDSEEYLMRLVSK